MVDAPSTQVDKVETAANIYVRIQESDNNTYEIPASEIDRTKEVDAERVREMGLYPAGYAINSIDVDGSITFPGSKIETSDGTKNLDEVLFDDNGIPITFNITIAKEDPMNPQAGEDTETLTNCIMTTSEYSASSGESTESSFDFMAERMVHN